MVRQANNLNSRGIIEPLRAKVIGHITQLPKPSGVVVMIPDSLYCDGGVIGRNPSTNGGTWAWCWTEKTMRTRTGSGVVTPVEIGLERVTNNLTEFLAAVNVLESVADGWDGTLYTDSAVTLLRVRQSKYQAKLNGIPPGLVERLVALKARLGRYSVVLVGGHPTRLDFVRGKNKDGLPVSSHNIWCDDECKRQAMKYRRSYGAGESSTSGRVLAGARP